LKREKYRYKEDNLYNSNFHIGLLIIKLLKWISYYIK